jgi:hypothetical protein
MSPHLDPEIERTPHEGTRDLPARQGSSDRTVIRVSLTEITGTTAGSANIGSNVHALDTTFGAAPAHVRAPQTSRLQSQDLRIGAFQRVADNPVAHPERPDVSSVTAGSIMRSQR